MEESKNFKDEIDSWIKDLNSRISLIEDLPHIVKENTDNIQHNYELISDLLYEINELKMEVNSLKLIQIINITELENLKKNLKNHKENEKCQTSQIF